MMNLLTWLPRGKCQFVNSGQATVLRRYFVARRFTVPKCQQIQARKSKILTAPCDINANYVCFCFGDLREARDHVNEVLEPANITGVGIVHPTVDVNEKQRTLRL